MAPVIKPWSDADAYDAIYGQTEVDGVTFANFGATNCGDNRDFAISNTLVLILY